MNSASVGKIFKPTLNDMKLLKGTKEWPIVK